MNDKKLPSSESNPPSKCEPALDELLDLLARKHLNDSNPHCASALQNATDPCHEE